MIHATQLHESLIYLRVVIEQAISFLFLVVAIILQNWKNLNIENDIQIQNCKANFMNNFLLNTRDVSLRLLNFKDPQYYCSD